MLILMSLVLLAIWAAMLFSLFNVLNPFIDTLWDIKNYNVAYYWAIASIERAELAIRKHKPWFEWESWWEWAVNDFWNSNDWKHDDFWLLAKGQNWMSWKIESRAKENSWKYVIPYPWDNNIEPQMTGTDSENFNAREREYEPEIYLHIDNVTNEDRYYQGPNDSDILPYDWLSVDATFRLPPKVSPKLWDLNHTSSQEVNGIWNDIIVLWTLLWENSWWDKFTIQPNIKVDYAWDTVDINDSAIRESNINDSDDISFAGDKNPVQSDSTSQYAIPENVEILWSFIETLNFSQIFDWSKNQIIKFSQINNLISIGNNIYPYLEYKFEFDELVADRFYTITWTWKAWKYLVELEIKKPTAKSKKYWDITVAN